MVIIIPRKKLWRIISIIIVVFFLNVGLFCHSQFKNRKDRVLVECDAGKHTNSDIDDRQGKLAIVIDDFGQDRNGVEEMLSIKKKLTIAVMPFLQFSYKDAETAHKRGYEVIVHLPLESTMGRKDWLGPKPVFVSMEDEEVRCIVKDSIENIPYAVGLNTHMGSKASEDERIISIILDIIKEEKLYFLDSRACNNPIAKEIAEGKGVVCFDRDVFIDGKKPKQYIKEQLNIAIDIALSRGYAIVIGHVGAEGGKVTAQAIKEMIPEFERRNIELVFVSELI